VYTSFSSLDRLPRNVPQSQRRNVSCGRNSPTRRRYERYAGYYRETISWQTDAAYDGRH
jgi:hypothetical protein